MSDPRYGAALVRTVIADPTDRTARAVLADWLSEGDDAEQALLECLRGPAIPEVIVACPHVNGAVTVLMRWGTSHLVGRWSLAQWRAIPSQ